MAAGDGPRFGQQGSSQNQFRAAGISSLDRPGRFNIRKFQPGALGLGQSILRHSLDGRYQLRHGRRTRSTIWHGVHPTCQPRLLGRCRERISSVEDNRRVPCEAIVVRIFWILDETVLNRLGNTRHDQGFSEAFLHQRPVRAAIEVERLRSHWYRSSRNVADPTDCECRNCIDWLLHLSSASWPGGIGCSSGFEHRDLPWWANASEIRSVSRRFRDLPGHSIAATRCREHRGNRSSLVTASPKRALGC